MSETDNAYDPTEQLPDQPTDDARLELIESFWHDDLDCLVDVYWNGEYGRTGECRAKILRTDEWLDEIDVAQRARDWNPDDEDGGGDDDG